MKTMTAVEAHQKIERAAENNSPDIRNVREIAEGKAVRQGDIYIHRVADGHPHGKEMTHRQLAVGSNMNARHVAEAPARVYEGTTAPKDCTTTLLGPCVVSDLPFTVSHPEHAHVNLPPGHYQVTHQQDARTLDRVRD